MKTKLKTIALNPNQHLIKNGAVGIVETYCKGFTDGKRDKNLDGFYFNSELKIK